MIENNKKKTFLFFLRSSFSQNECVVENDNDVEKWECIFIGKLILVSVGFPSVILKIQTAIQRLH